MRVKSLPLSETFSLESDPEKQATVTVRQAREEEHIRRQDLFSRITRVYENENESAYNRVRIEMDQNSLRLRRMECYLVLEDVSGVLNESEKELFQSTGGVQGKLVRNAMSQGEFERAWGMLDEETATEIHGYVMKMNPMWDDQKK